MQHADDCIGRVGKGQVQVDVDSACTSAIRRNLAISTSTPRTPRHCDVQINDEPQHNGSRTKSTVDVERIAIRTRAKRTSAAALRHPNVRFSQYAQRPRIVRPPTLPRGLCCILSSAQPERSAASWTGHHFHFSRTSDVDFHRSGSVPEAFLADTGLGQGGRHKIVSAQIYGLARQNAPLNTRTSYRESKPRAVLTAVPRLMTD
ncbi:hypothetical protein BU25DRAFT_476264 [Macroventuria anomochaeta]|uniref:Uncharacterized protein n=1 Tax=Macroventuria anomochaeta TaxID=301207 RepID=A0ACB6RTC9_9PLEO|nr:uncharacterized protein BU25DRAFT_476264 [Macroventuria anomochaeta]KAF2624537.1 hypothetical protein BU25DRAFT_476264 [Macroventuria anomochaeta]